MELQGLRCYEFLVLKVIGLARKKLKKHPMEMTDEEALRHLFHPKIVRAVKKHLKEQEEENGEPKAGK